ncbi:hypothetical protein K4K54_001651, partial [Colletotrichum sp. SAR 10_86]
GVYGVPIRLRRRPLDPQPLDQPQRLRRPAVVLQPRRRPRPRGAAAALGLRGPAVLGRGRPRRGGRA